METLVYLYIMRGREGIQQGRSKKFSENLFPSLPLPPSRHPSSSHIIGFSSEKLLEEQEGLLTRF